MSKNNLRASSGLLQKNKYTNLKKKKFHLPHIPGEIDSAMTREDLVPALHDPGSPAPLSESLGAWVRWEMHSLLMFGGLAH